MKKFLTKIKEKILSWKNIGDKIESENDFPSNEGSINMYYGMIGSGKTYSATADIHDLLMRGETVYCSWPIEVENFDSRKSFFLTLFNLITFKNKFYEIKCKENLHYFDPEQFETKQEYIEWLNSLNNCHIFIDEAWDLFDSYEGTKFSKLGRGLILKTRHKKRTLNVIAQRPTSIQVSARGMCNRFYKCMKKNFLWIPIFYRFEFQDMTLDNVDETKEPISTKIYIPKAKIFNSYNSFAYGDQQPSQKLFYDTYLIKFNDFFKLFIYQIFSFLLALKPKGKKK